MNLFTHPNAANLSRTPLDAAPKHCYNNPMATTARTPKTRTRARRREKPLGAAIAFGLAVTLGVGLVILVAQLLSPGSFLRQYFELLRHAPSATLPLSPLYQQLSERVAREEALFATPLSLLCGGLTVGLLAPRYAPKRRVLLSAGLMAFGILAVSLAFLWVDSIATTNLLNSHEGGDVTHPTAPFAYLLLQALWGLAWIGACVFGAWLGLHGRDWRVSREAARLATR